MSDTADLQTAPDRRQLRRPASPRNFNADGRPNVLCSSKLAMFVFLNGAGQPQATKDAKG